MFRIVKITGARPVVLAVVLSLLLMSCLAERNKRPPIGNEDPASPILPLQEDKSVYNSDVNGVITVNVAMQPGGATLDEVNSDIDYTDDYAPLANVRVSADGYPFDDGSTQIDGTLGIRGHTSRLADQKSYKIKFNDPNARWMGLDTLELNKHPFDITRIRQKISFAYFSIIPYMTSLRTQFIHLYIDGVDHGLYTLVEDPNKKFLARHGLDRYAYLYKAEEFEFVRYPDKLLNPDDPNYSQKTFETVLTIKGEDRNHDKLFQMIDDVNNEDIDINKVIADHFERNNYLTWFAINILLRNDDTNTQNFFLYSPRTSYGWYFLPWDYDGSWDDSGQPAAEQRARWTEGVSNWWNVPLHKRFLKDPNDLKDLIGKVEELRAYFTEAATKQYIDAFKALTYDLVTAEPDVDFLPSYKSDVAGKVADLNGEYDRLLRVPEESYQLFMKALERPMPVWLGDPVQGNVMTSFHWGESYDLQGDGITYDFQISSDPSFDSSQIVYERLGLTDVSIDVPNLNAGTYYYRVIIRDTKDPSNNWQSAFDAYFDADGKQYYGIKSFVAQ